MKLWNKSEEASDEAQDNGEEQQGSEKQRSIQSLSDAELQVAYADARQCYKKRADSNTTRRLAIARREMRRRQLPEEDVQ